MIGRIVRTLLASSLALTMAAAAVPAHAGNADVIRRGSCSGRTDWKLKLSPEDGRIEVEFEVDSNRVGQTWRVRIEKNGHDIFRGTRVTRGPSGSFEVRLVTPNRAGNDVFRAHARNGASGEACLGRATF